MTDVTRYFKNIKDADSLNRGQYIVPGHYDLTVKAIKIQQSKNPQRGNPVDMIAEFEVDAFDGSMYKNTAGEDCTSAGKYKPGDSVTKVINLDNQMGPANAKQLLVAIFSELDTDTPLPEIEAQVDEDDFAKLVSADQPAAGVKLVCSAWNITTKAGNDFTVSQFSAQSR